MKIGLISINMHTKVLNFACPVHTYAFQKFLLTQGIETTIIDYKPNYAQKFNAKHPLFYYAAHREKDIKKWTRNLKLWTRLFREREYRFKRFQEFIDRHYIKTEKCYDQEILETEDPGFDCYICVTDVIWKNIPQRGFDRGFFLACKSMAGKKKIAYAASRGPATGKRSYTEEREKEFLEYISDFDFVSVREASFKTYIEGISDVPAGHVLDPVFLMEKDFYSGLAFPPFKKNYVLVYTVIEKADSIVKFAIAYAAAHGLSVINISDQPANVKIPEGISYEYHYGLGVEDWLGYIENAEVIFTNSFHSCCFSIIFHKQFYAGKRDGDKIDSLLELFQLSWRRFGEKSTLGDLCMDDIDYSQVDVLRKKYVEQSAQYILDAIHYLEKNPHGSNHKSE